MLEKGKKYTVKEILEESDIDYKDKIEKVKCTIGGIRGCTKADKEVRIPKDSKSELVILFGDKKSTVKLK